MANFRNLAYGLVRTPPSPPTSGNTLVLEAGHAARLPAVPFDATIWPVTSMPDPLNAEIVSVTAVDVLLETLTITRAQQGTTARAIIAGDQLAGTITKAYLDVVPLTSDPVVTFVGTVNTGPLTANGGLATNGDVHVAGNVTMNGTVLTGPLTADGGIASNGNLSVAGLVTSPRLLGYREPFQQVTLSGATLPINYAAGNHAIVVLSADVTAITITNVPASADVAPVMVWYVAVSGGHAVTHTINGHAVRFPDGPALVMSTLANRIDRILYTTWDGGTTWIGDIIGTNY